MTLSPDGLQNFPALLESRTDTLAGNQAVTDGIGVGSAGQSQRNRELQILHHLFEHKGNAHTPGLPHLLLP